MALVAFLDILGTKEQILADEFLPDAGSLDFANAVGLTAYLAPKLHFAVFSDSVIVSSEENDAEVFVKALGHIYANWYGDLILVRGGIAAGEIDWVEDIRNDPFFRKLRNFMYARVYGRAVVEAHQLEQRSGPGAVCFLSEKASKALSNVHQNAVLEGPVDCLAWATERIARTVRDYMELGASREIKETERRRHLLATKHYWDRIVREQKFLPDHFQLPPDRPAAVPRKE